MEATKYRYAASAKKNTEKIEAIISHLDAHIQHMQ
jgi:hypothetical protein